MNLRDLGGKFYFLLCQVFTVGKVLDMDVMSFKVFLSESFFFFFFAVNLEKLKDGGGHLLVFPVYHIL